MASGGGDAVTVGGFMLYPAGLGSASEVRRVRGAISHGAACGLGCGEANKK